MPICQGGADSVGASGGFTPVSAWNKVDARQASQELSMIERGVRKVKIPVVRNSLRTIVNCRAVCSISDGEAIDKPTL
ncbi:MAG: hypothetical protein E6I97_18010 [Chloroflexi bacterium]|nr:MAG: hypothetical protein E6I97_18010 [Chloroflexota bacterium]